MVNKGLCQSKAKLVVSAAAGHEREPGLGPSQGGSVQRALENLPTQAEEPCHFLQVASAPERPVTPLVLCWEVCDSHLEQAWPALQLAQSDCLSLQGEVGSCTTQWKYTGQWMAFLSVFRAGGLSAL